MNNNEKRSYLIGGLLIALGCLFLVWGGSGLTHDPRDGRIERDLTVTSVTPAGDEAYGTISVDHTPRDLWVPAANVKAGDHMSVWYSTINGSVLTDAEAGKHLAVGWVIWNLIIGAAYVAAGVIVVGQGVKKAVQPVNQLVHQ